MVSGPRIMQVLFFNEKNIMFGLFFPLNLHLNKVENEGRMEKTKTSLLVSQLYQMMWWNLFCSPVPLPTFIMTCRGSAAVRLCYIYRL